MYITKTKTKNTTIYYLNKSYRDVLTKKVTTKVVERIGSQEEIQKKIGKGKNIDVWLKNYAVRKTKEAKKSDVVSLTLSVDSRINQNNQRIFNGGYLAIRNLCYEIGLNEICVDIAKKEKFKGDLFQILVNLICVNVMVEGKTLETSELAKTFIEQPRYTKRQFYQAIEIFAKYDYYIQIQMLDKMDEVVNRSKSHYYYDANYFYHDFTNKQEDSLKEVKDDLWIRYELSVDNLGFPIGYTVYSRDNDYNDDIYKFENLQKEKFKDSILIALANFNDSNLSIIAKASHENSRSINVIDLNTLDKETQDWIFDEEGWRNIFTNKEYNLFDIRKVLNDEKADVQKQYFYKYTRFYKTKQIKYFDKVTGKTSNQDLIVVYGNEIEDLNYETNKNKIEKILLNIDRNVLEHYDDPDYCNKYIEKFKKYLDIDKAKNPVYDYLGLYKLKNDVPEKLGVFNGYYGVVLDKDVDAAEAIRLQTTKWFNDYQFSNVAKDFQKLPKYIRYRDRINAHFIISYLALVVLRLAGKKSGWRYSYFQLYKSCLELNFLYINDEGWIPIFNLNEVTPLLQKIISKDITKDFIPNNLMNKIISKHP